ncbi:MAG: helix-turn-helix transcriptional regulator [Clostridiales bacterium]|nr:helix-turn-helix transcriptional regulator [Clostridiales bacterium]
MKTFGQNLKLLRQQAGISQKVFAEKMQTTQQRVSEWETDKVEPTLTNIIKILSVLDVSFEDLTADIEK